MNREIKRDLNIKSRQEVDHLVEKTVSSLCGSSFVFDTTLNTIEHRFLNACRTLDIDERAYFNNSEGEKREYAKLEAIPYGVMF